MLLIEQFTASFINGLQANLPAWVIGWFVPLPILLFYALLLRPWVQKVGYNLLYIGFVYLLSLSTGVLVTLTQDISDSDGALVAGVYAPIVYGTLVALIIAIAQLLRRLFGRKTSARPLRGFTMLLRVVLGGMIGTIIGFVAGATVGFTVLTLLAVRLRPLFLVYDLFSNMLVTNVLFEQVNTLSTYSGALLGCLLGIGWGIRANAPFEDRSYEGWYLREFHPADQQAVRALLKNVQSQRFAYVDNLLERDLDHIYTQYTAQGETFLLALTADEEILGCGALVATENSAYVSHITHLVVAPEEKRPEVLHSLVRGLIKVSRQRRFRRVIVEIPEEWDAAVQLYKQMGFTADQRGFDSTLGGVKLRLLIE